MPAKILSEFQNTNIRHHLDNGKGTRLVRVTVNG